MGEYHIGMGMKFEYTQTPLADHWDADHFVSFWSLYCVSAGHWHSIGGSSRRLGGSGSVIETALPLPTWEEDLKDRLIPIVSLAFTTAILEAVKAGSTVLIITVPTWISIAALVIVLGDIARRHIWQDHPESKLMNIRLFCPTQEIHDGLARYFQGTWEL